MLTNISRREFIQRIGAASLVSFVGLTEGCRKRSTAQTNGQDLRFWGTGTLSVGDDVWGAMQRDIGAHIIFKDNYNTPGPVIAQMVGGSAATDYDLGGLLTGAVDILAQAGTILPWDLSKVPNWDTAWPWAKNLQRSQYKGRQYGLPLVVNADSMIYLPDKIKNVSGYESGIVDSYSAIFDPLLKGKTSMEDAWVNSVLFTAIYLKENSLLAIRDPRNLTESELKGVMEFLIDKKRSGQFKKLWKDWVEGLELLRTGDVVVMTGWEPMVKALTDQGVSAKYAVPREGYEGWSIDLLLHTGAAKRGLVDVCHSAANWLYKGDYGLKMAIERGYAVPNDRTITYIQQTRPQNSDQVVDILRNKQLRISNTVYWQNVRPDNYRLYDEWWSKLQIA